MRYLSRGSGMAPETVKLQHGEELRTTSPTPAARFTKGHDRRAHSLSPAVRTLPLLIGVRPPRFPGLITKLANALQPAQVAASNTNEEKTDG